MRALATVAPNIIKPEMPNGNRQIDGSLPAHVRRTHKMTLREFETVQFEAIAEGDRAAVAAKMALAAMTLHTHAAKQMKLLESAVAGQKQLEMDIRATLEFFKSEQEPPKPN